MAGTIAAHGRAPNRRSSRTDREVPPRRCARRGASTPGAGLAASAGRHTRSARHGSAPAAAGAGAIRTVSCGSRRPASRRPRVARHQSALYAPGPGRRARARPPERRCHHAHGIGQDALLQRAGAARDPAGSGEPRAVSLSDQGARPGPARRAADDVRDARRPIGRSNRRVHVRRRHAAGREADHSGARASRPQQPGHAALRHPAAPSAVGEAVREPSLRRHRRTARISWRVRQPSVQRAAPAATGLPALRIRPGLHLFVGDDCESAGAGRAPRRTAVRAGRRERRAARREGLRLRQPADRQPSAGHPALVSRRDAAHRRGVSQAPPSAHRLCPEPSRDRDPDDLFEGRFRGRAWRARVHPRLSGRISAESPPRDREGTPRWRGTGRGVHQCAGAGHRHRRVGRQCDGGVSRHDCRDVAARRARRGGARADPPPSWWPAARRSISSSFATRRISSTPLPNERSSIPTTCTSCVDHIKCAAFEMPFSTVEEFGRHDLQEILGLLAEQGLVHRTGPADDLDGPAGERQWMWTNESYPADAVSLRSISSDNFVIVDTTRETRVIGETDFTSGPADAASEGDLHCRRPAVSGGAPRLRGAQGVRAARSIATTTPARSPTHA